MKIPLRRWQEVQRHFTDDEKANLTKAVVGETICPHGAIIDEAQLHPDLRAKLRFHFMGEGELRAAS